MKRNDIIKLSLSVAALIVVLAFAYRYFVPAPKNSGIQVEVPRPVTPTFDQDQLNTLKREVKDFSQDLTPKDNGGTKPVIQ